MKIELRKKARKLRRRGLSYKEIKDRLGVTKSTLSLWLKNIQLKPEYKKRLYTKQIEILSRGPMCQKERRKREVDAIIENAVHEIKFPVSEDAHKLFGAALYWAEGSKGKDFKVTNSDPYFILFMVHWLKEIFQVDPANLKMRINMYSQQNERTLKKFWSDLTGIPIANFGKSYVKPANKNYKKNNLYYGTVQIYVPRGTDKKHRIFGWIKAILQNIESEVTLVERRWESLKKTPRPVNLPL